MPLAVHLQNRPFAIEPLTGMQVPDGTFEAAFPRLRIAAQFRNDDAAPLSLRVYLESASDPNIVVTAQTHALTLPAGAVTLLLWEIDVTKAAVGAHYVSFAMEDDAGNTHRVIRKIFVTRTVVDHSDGTFVIEVPEGRLRVRVNELLGPAAGPGCDPPADGQPPDDIVRALTDYLRDPPYGPDQWRQGPFLPVSLDVALEPAAAYPGPTGDLPFSDPWWKTVLIIVAIILIIAAIVVAVIFAGPVIVGGGAAGATVAFACCVTPAALVATGLGVAGVAAAAVAAFEDGPDPFRRGQESTPPGPGEVTVRENLAAKLEYLEPIVPGTPFRVGIDFTYRRTTVDAAGAERVYAHAEQTAPANTHLLSRYEVDTRDVVRTVQDPIWVVKARFFDGNDVMLRGPDLFVQCFLVGPAGQEYQFLMHDDGVREDPNDVRPGEQYRVDEEANDGWYTGAWRFVTPASRGLRRAQHKDDTGVWLFYVVAQDINDAQPNMTAEDAATHVGGVLLTGQLKISFSGGTCDLVRDGHVQVV